MQEMIYIQSKKDGSSREKMNLKMENASRFCIQRGNVYYVTHVTDPAKLTETEGVYRVPLDGGNPVPIAEVQGNAIFEIYPYGDFVYGWWHGKCDVFVCL